MKKIFLLIAIVFSLTSNAQVTHVSLKASGLTCSMCSNSINKALKTLDFILTIEADISTYTFELCFKSNSVVDFDLIKKKVENAGFTVAGFVATVLFDNVQVLNSQAVTIDGKTFLFTGVKEQTLNGARKIKVLDKGFVSPKEYKKSAFPVLATHTYTVTL
ncbi:MAG: heavy-metal-associated domain-containing protein [Bacteroidota bacterium]